MEEIKYRLWDKATQRMYQPQELAELRVGQLLSNWVEDGTDTVMPLRFTGLRDSQIVEEYFGDIVIEETENDWILYVIKDGKSAVLFEDTKTGAIKCFWDLGVCYVVGNIYENSEILN